MRNPDSGSRSGSSDLALTALWCTKLPYVLSLIGRGSRNCLLGPSHQVVHVSSRSVKCRSAARLSDRMAASKVEQPSVSDRCRSNAPSSLQHDSVFVRQMHDLLSAKLRNLDSATPEVPGSLLCQSWGEVKSLAPVGAVKEFHRTAFRL